MTSNPIFTSQDLANIRLQNEMEIDFMKAKHFNNALIKLWDAMTRPENEIKKGEGE